MEACWFSDLPSDLRSPGGYPEAGSEPDGHNH